MPSRGSLVWGLKRSDDLGDWQLMGAFEEARGLQRRLHSLSSAGGFGPKESLQASSCLSS